MLFVLSGVVCLRVADLTLEFLLFCSYCNIRPRVVDCHINSGLQLTLLGVADPIAVHVLVSPEDRSDHPRNFINYVCIQGMRTTRLSSAGGSPRFTAN